MCRRRDWWDAWIFLSGGGGGWGRMVKLHIYANVLLYLHLTPTLPPLPQPINAFMSMCSVSRYITEKMPWRAQRKRGGGLWVGRTYFTYLTCHYYDDFEYLSLSSVNSVQRCVGGGGGGRSFFNGLTTNMNDHILINHWFAGSFIIEIWGECAKSACLFSLPPVLLPSTRAFFNGQE